MTLFSFFFHPRCHLILYSFLMALLFVFQLAGIFAAVELRSTINNNEYAAADALPSLEHYTADPAQRARWDALQSEFKCCGALNFNDGYRIWRNADIGRETNGVPDSCCLRPSEGCGERVFAKQEATLDRVIHMHGCLTLLQDKLTQQVVPVLLGYAGVGVCLALLQLLAVVFACSYSAQISRRRQRQDSEDERRYLQGEVLSAPNTPRFDIVRNQSGGFVNDNMGHVFVGGDNTLNRKYANASPVSDMDERPV